MSFGGVNTFQQYSTDFGLGHNGVKISFNYFDGFPEPSLLNSLASNDLKLIFKSLLKRDETTKEKALNDLLRLVEGYAENEHLFASDIFFLCWSQVYPKLLVSESKAIRVSSHLVTSKLIKLLNKKVSKFLKDVMPLLLLGACDTDSSVSKACHAFLNDIFDCNKTKVNSLWSVFQEDILKVIDELVVKENEETISDERFVGKDDSLLRFNRLITSAVQLLTNLIRSGSFDAVKYEEIVHEILTSETLWQLLSLKNTHFVKSYEAALQLQKTLYTNGLLKSQKDVLKLSAKKLLKSLSHLNSQNALKVAPVTGLIVDNLTLLDHYKGGKVWSYDKSGKEKFLQFATVATKNPTPGFYSSLYEFYVQSSSHELLDDEKEWLPLWQASNNALKDKIFLGRYGPEILGELWTNYRKFIDHCTVEGADVVAKEDAMSILRSGKEVSKIPPLKTALVNFLDPDFLASEILAEAASDDKETGPLLNNLVQLLCVGDKNETALRNVTNAMLELMSADQDGLSLRKKKILQTYTYFVKTGVSSISDEIAQFVYEIPTWIDTETYENLSIFITDYSKSVLAKKDKNFVSIMEDFLTAATSAGISQRQIIRTLNLLHIGVSSEVLSSAAVQEFVQHYIDSYDYDDDGEIFNGDLINDRNVIELYEQTVEKRQTDAFICHLSTLNQSTLTALLTKSDFLSSHLFGKSSEQSETIYRLLQPLLDNYAVVQSLAAAIGLYARRKPIKVIDNHLLEIAEEVIALQGNSLTAFLPSNLEEEFAKVVPFIDHRLALVGSLKLNTHLSGPSSDELDLSEVEELIKFGLFLDVLLSRVPVCQDMEICIFITMVSELAQDFNCLSEEPKGEFDEFENTLYKQKWIDFSFEDAVDAVCQINSADQSSLGALSILIRAVTSTAVTYYHLCIFQKVLQNKVDCVSLATFSRKFPAIESFVVSTIRGKENNQHEYLLSGMILSTVEKFSDLDVCAKLRNILASECIGVKESELLNSSYKNIILLTNLLRSQQSTEATPPFPPQRLNMMLSSLSQWLDSDVAYEPGFAPVRLALLRFCALLARIPAIIEASSALRELSVTLLTDSLSMCLLDDTSFLFELRLYCLLLHEQLNKSKGNKLSESASEEMLDVLIELSLVSFTAERNNQISAVYYRALSKVLSRFQVKKAAKFYPDLFSSFLSNEGFGNINRTRMIFAELKRLVIERQKDAFLEFEFEKQKKQGNATGAQTDENAETDSDVSDKFQLPEELINKMCTEVPEDYLESENKFTFLRYLWLWDLTFCFFGDASYDLRQKFIDQLKSRDLITTFFDFISDQIDLKETKFWSDAGPSAILDYSVQNNDFSPYEEDVYSECKKLLGHSMYNMFLNLGSLTSSWWLNIKDRTLQAKIEKFVAAFISPILIAKELDDVAEKTSKLESNDTALTIKINKVTNEVKASYLIDEQKLELSFKLPANYPLTNVQVVGVSRVGISEQKWKQWILSTQRVITGMNGSVVDSLDLFSNNVNLQFSGFEECAICYSILHIVDRKLPTKTCPTCNNKFHGACLYKWFRSSGNNTCPLCRSEIPFRR